MRTNPEPDDDIAIAHGQRAITESDAHRVDGLARVDRFETKAWVVRIDGKQAICGTRLLTNVFRQARERSPETRRRDRGQMSPGTSASFPSRRR